MTKYLTLFATLTIFSGCCTVPAQVPFECPERFEFSQYSDELWLSLPEEAQQNIVNDLADMQGYIKACEAAAEIHND